MAKWEWAYVWKAVAKRWRRRALLLEVELVDVQADADYWRVQCMGVAGEKGKHILELWQSTLGFRGGDLGMGNYSFDVLLRKWSLGEITVEQAVGQIIQILLRLAKRIEELEASR